MPVDTMTEQSQNTVFHSSSFLQGQNAEFVEQLHARYAEDPASVDASWQAFFRGLDDAASDVQQSAARPELGARRLAAGADRRADRGARRPVGAGAGEGGRRQGARQGGRGGRRAHRGAGAAGGARLACGR